MSIDNKGENIEMDNYSEASDGLVALAGENGSSGAESIEFVSTSRSGDDLVLELGSGELEVIADYFSPNFSEKSVEIQGESMDVFVLRVLLADSAEDVVLTVVGEVSSLEGAAHAVNPFGEKREIQEGDDVFFGEEILLEDASSLSLTMNDASTLTLGSGARMVIDSHVFDESASEGNESLLTLLKGTFLYLSGQVAKKNYDDVGLVTPVGTIGIRGTSLVVEVKGTGEDETMDVVLLSGAVRVRDEEGADRVVDEPLVSLEVDKEGVREQGEKADPVSLAEQYGALFYVAGDENLERIAEDLKEQGADNAHVDIFLEEVSRIEELLDSGGDFDFSQLNERDEFDPLSGDTDEDVNGVLSEGVDSGSGSGSSSSSGRVESSLFVADGEEAPRVSILPRVVVPVIALLEDTSHKDTGIGVDDKVTSNSGLVFSLGSGDTLVVYGGDGQEVYREKAGTDGKITWSPVLKEDGEYTYRAQAIDEVGDKSDMKIFSFEYDGTAPGIPKDVGILSSGVVIASESGKLTTSELNPTFHVKLSSEEEGSFLVVYSGRGTDNKPIEVGRGVVGKDGVATVKVTNDISVKGQNIGYQLEFIDKAGQTSEFTNSLTVSYVDAQGTPPSLPVVQTAGEAQLIDGKSTDITKSPGYNSFYASGEKSTIVVAKADYALLSFHFAKTSDFYDGDTVGNVEVGLFKDGTKVYSFESDSVTRGNIVSFYEDFSSAQVGTYDVRFKLTGTNGATSDWLTPGNGSKVKVVSAIDFDSLSLIEDAFVYEEGESEEDVSDGGVLSDEGEGGDFDFSEDVAYSSDGGVSDDYEVPSVDVL